MSYLLTNCNQSYASADSAIIRAIRAKKLGTKKLIAYCFQRQELTQNIGNIYAVYSSYSILQSKHRKKNILYPAGPEYRLYTLVMAKNTVTRITSRKIVKSRTLMIYTAGISGTSERFGISDRAWFSAFDFQGPLQVIMILPLIVGRASVYDTPR
eukprot:67085-Amorphochlora_amoeboformis.AAC.1